MTVTTKVPLGADTLNRKWYLDVNTGTHAAPVWVGVFGITEFKPELAPEKESDADFESGGWGSQALVELAWSLALKVQRKTQAADATAYDPGQEVLRAAGGAIGPANVVEVRWYEYAGAAGGPEVEAYQGYASVTWSDDGGDTKALATASVTLDGRGARTPITHPATAAAPTIYAVSPASGVAGDLVKITGVGFTGATDVDFGLNACGDFFIHDNHTIYAVVPAGGTGGEQVIVTNATGASDDEVYFTYTA